MACNNNDVDNCGCSHQHSAKCIFYKGGTLSCIDVVYDDDLETILENIDAAVCALTPSGSVSVVESCDENIEVTSETSGQTTTYTVCLNSDITDRITELENDVGVLETCVENGVLDITSTTLTITETDTGECGRTLNIEFNPSGIVTYDGIIHNDTDKDGTTGAVGDKILKSFNYDYETNNLIAANDEIRFTATGQIYGDGAAVDTVKIQLFDAGGATVLWESTYAGFALGDVYYSWRADAELVVTDVAGGEGLLNIHFLAIPKINGIKSNTTISLQEINTDVTGIDYTNLSIRVIYIHNSTTGATDNFARKLMVEVRKYIG